MRELSFRSMDATGPELAYRDSVDVAGELSAKHIQRFAKARRKSSFGPTTVYYAGLSAPAITAGVAALASFFTQDYQIAGHWRTLIITLFAAVAGLTWYILFMRLAQRNKFGRNDETVSRSRVVISETGVEVSRGDVLTTIKWPAVVDVKTTRHYIALIVENANDILLPVDWFADQAAMTAAAKKISALRPPPFDA